MPSPNLNLESRISALNSVLSKSADQNKVDAALKAASGDWTVARATLVEGNLAAATLKKLDLAHSLADWAEDNTPVIKALVEQREIKSLRDVALNYNVDKLAEIVDPETIPETTVGESIEDKKKNFAVTLQRKLFATETSATLQRMTQDAVIPIADKTLRTGVVSFLNNQPDFNIRTTSIYTALKHPEAFKNIAEEQRAGVVEQLKTLQRVQALSPIPEAVPLLMNANLTSAFQVGELPESTFLSAHSEALGEEIAK